jgi:hypothetical protein
VIRVNIPSECSSRARGIRNAASIPFSTSHRCEVESSCSGIGRASVDGVKSMGSCSPNVVVRPNLLGAVREDRINRCRARILRPVEGLQRLATARRQQDHAREDLHSSPAILQNGIPGQPSQQASAYCVCCCRPCVQPLVGLTQTRPGARGRARLQVHHHGHLP